MITSNKSDDGTHTHKKRQVHHGNEIRRGRHADQTCIEKLQSSHQIDVADHWIAYVFFRAPRRASRSQLAPCRGQQLERKLVKNNGFPCLVIHKNFHADVLKSKLPWLYLGLRMDCLPKLPPGCLKSKLSSLIQKLKECTVQTRNLHFVDVSHKRKPAKSIGCPYGLSSGIPVRLFEVQTFIVN